MNSLLRSSVVLPVHGAAPFFELALGSVLFQTLPAQEIVVVDDSGQGSFEGRAHAVMDRWPDGTRLVYVRNPSNLGLVASLNAGLAAASGEVVFRMDADDLSLPNRFEVQLTALAAGFDVVGGAIVRFRPGWERQVRYPRHPLGMAISLARTCPFAHPAVAYRRQAILELGGYRAVSHAEDLDLWMRCYAAGLRFTNVPIPVLLYREHADQVSSKHDAVQQVNAAAVRRTVWAALFRRLSRHFHEHSI